MRHTWILILEVETDDVRVVSVAAGVKPKADPAYRCHGPFASKASACRAIDQKSGVVRHTFYENGKQFVDHEGS